MNNESVRSGGWLWALGLLSLGILLTGCGRAKTAPQVDLTSCLRSLTNVAAFAETPLGKPKLISSYDRFGGNADWDTLNVVQPDGLRSIVDIEGPGCVRRIWVTGFPAETEFHFFFDGERSPRLQVSWDKLFGGEEPFVEPICNKLSGGAYCYIPFPFSKSLRIAVSLPPEEKPRAYYQVNYEIYDASVRVRSFPRDLSARETEILRKVKGVWEGKAEITEGALESCAKSMKAPIPARQAVSWLDYDGPGLLRTFWIRLHPSPEMTAMARSRLLRELVLRIFWDGSSAPSVEVPIGDFFCNGSYLRTFASFPLANHHGALVCRFPMPFGKSVRAELRNDGESSVVVEAGYDLVPENGERNNINYFHARWNSSMDSGIPYRILRAEKERRLYRAW